MRKRQRKKNLKKLWINDRKRIKKHPIKPVDTSWISTPLLFAYYGMPVSKHHQAIINYEV